MRPRESCYCLRALIVPVLAVLVLISPAPSALQQQPATGRVWLDAQGNALPFKNDEDVLDFLRTAQVASEKLISTGITGVHKLTLEKDGVRANAVFRTVDEEKTSITFMTGRSELGFRDSFLFEPAAYELSRLLGLDTVPPATLRKLHGQPGSIQIWVENAMTEGARLKNKTQPPDAERWNQQTQNIVVFDALIYNTDRNVGNLLITPDWKVWMIDHTRAFRRMTELQQEKKFKRCERGLYERLKALDETTTRQRLKPYLRSEEIKAILKRRDLIVKKLDGMIAEQGADAVLFTMTP